MDHLLMDRLLRLAIATPESVANLLQEINQADLPELLTVAKEEKLFIQVYEALAPHFEVPLPFQQRYKNYMFMRSENLKLLQDCSEKLLGSVDYLVFKGISVEAFYPKHMKRSFNDLDLITPDIENFWGLASYLLENNLLLNTTMNLYRDQHTSKIIGAARFESEPEDDYVREIEVQIGTFFLSLITHIPTYVLLPYRQLNKIHDVTVPCLNRTGTWVVLLAELMTLESARLRDLVDAVYLCEGAEDEFDLQEIARICQVYHLEYALYHLQKGFASQGVFEMPSLLKRLIDMVQLPAEEPDLLHAHIWPYLKKHSKTPYLNYLNYKLRDWTIRLNDANRMLPLLRQMDLYFGTKRYFENGLPVYFSILNGQSHPWYPTRIGKYEVVLTPIGSFAVSKHALQSDAELDELDVKSQQLVENQMIGGASLHVYESTELRKGV